jgi:hypothetical protein
MKFWRSLVCACLVALFVIGAADVRVMADTPQQAQNPPAKSPSQRWEKEIAAYEATDRKNPPPQGAILFTGASGIRMWKTLAEDFPQYKVVNRGFGGSEMADSVYFADRIVIPYKSPEQVLADFQAFVEKVRAKLPDTRIAYLGMNPSPSRWAQREKQQRGNRMIKQYVASEKNLDFIEFWDVLLGPDGKPREDLFIQDRLHNNAAGYKIRADVVRPYLK